MLEIDHFVRGAMYCLSGPLKLVLFLCAVVALAQHDNNVAIIVCSSRFWFNYRHLSNALTVYSILRSMGFDNDHIVLMNSLDIVDDTRNPFPGEVFNSKELDLNYFLHDIEVDFNDWESNVHSFMTLLSGRYGYGDGFGLSDFEKPSSHNSTKYGSSRNSDDKRKVVPLINRLHTNRSTNILIYMTGHGGDTFFKFNDEEEISTQDVGFLFHEMEMKEKYNEILLILDTCQASTFADSITSKRITTISSSLKDENSYAYETSADVAVSVLDRFTKSMLTFFTTEMGLNIAADTPINQKKDNSAEKGNKKNKHERKSKKEIWKNASLYDLMRSFDRSFLYSTATAQQTAQARPLKDIKVTDFFASTKANNDVVSAASGTLEDGWTMVRSEPPQQRRESGAYLDFNTYKEGVFQ